MAWNSRCSPGKAPTLGELLLSLQISGILGVSHYTHILFLFLKIDFGDQEMLELMCFDVIRCSTESLTGCRPDGRVSEVQSL